MRYVVLIWGTWKDYILLRRIKTAKEGAGLEDHALVLFENIIISVLARYQSRNAN